MNQGTTDNSLIAVARGLTASWTHVSNSRGKPGGRVILYLSGFALLGKDAQVVDLVVDGSAAIRRLRDACDAALAQMADVEPQRTGPG